MLTRHVDMRLHTTPGRRLPAGVPAWDDDETPWRLPTIDELEGLLDEDYDGEIKVVGGLRLSGCCPWSSEEHGSVSAWYFDFIDGRGGFVTRDYNEGGRALCVR